MSKPVTGTTHVGERRERRPNGDVYLYERVTAYNEQARKTYTVSQKLKGKIKSGTQEVITTRPKKRKGEGVVACAVRRHSGLTDILEWVGAASGIDDDLRSSFSEGDAAKILSIARYWIGSGGNTLPRLEGWQVMHSLPYSEAITEDVYGDLFKSVGRNEDGVQHYFSFRADRLGKHPVLVFDSTTIFTYSENQSEARRGFNKDGDGLNTIKLLTLYSVKEREPLAFARQPGNVPDVISIENALTQLKCFSLEKPLIVTDNGYYSQENMMKFALRNMKFLTYFGYFALVSNQSMGTFTALEDYRLREKIEELFAVNKGGLDGARPRTWYPDNLRGRQFVQFVSLGYHCFLTKKIKEMREGLGKNKSEKTAALVKLENNLDKWLEQRSLAQILDWFDCIETTHVQTAMGNYRWSTESVQRDRLFLEYLGVPCK